MKSIQSQWESCCSNFPAAQYQEIKTIDMHTAGEPLRVVVGGYPPIQGDTILQKRQWTLEHADHLRQILMYEPRGHADMYGCVIVEPEHQDSDFGVLFMHNEGYSTMCGHAIIAISKLVVESGFVPKVDPVTHLQIDTPAGTVRSQVIIKDGSIQHVTFFNVPSFVLQTDQSITTPWGEIRFDLAFGGAFYAYVDAEQIGLQLTTEHFSEIVSAGKKLKRQISEQFSVEHPTHRDLSFLYGVIFTSPPVSSDNHSRHVCVFADGEVDRSPTGTGVSGRIALLCSKGLVPLGETIAIESIIGTTFGVSASEQVSFENYQAFVPQVTGNAYVTGEHRFLIDRDDQTGRGFLLR